MRVELPAEVPAKPGARKPDSVLVIDSITRSFGGVRAVDVAHLEFQRGWITGLIGPNGAGKTTLFNLLTGFDRPDTGRWTFDGMPLSRLAPHQVARRGVVRTFQLTKALAKLTVLDNMRLAAPRARRWSCSAGFSWMPKPTISLAACPVASASCWKWPGP
jgi:branched-chain amino acid transport system ATP-binding protein